uniref:Protein nlrc3 n=1 Tax=Rhipicephalus appendiculatus TaxID=34631 RepID=A0A131YIN0_RHIAP
MSEEAGSEVQCGDAEIEELFQKGLKEHEEFSKEACAWSECSLRGQALDFRELSEEDARVLRSMLTSGRPVRKLSIWEISLSAFKIAFEDLEGCSSLEELHMFDIECDEQDFRVNLTGVFGNLHCLELYCTNIRTPFAREIATYVQDNKKLKDFTLAYSCGGDEGAAAISEALESNDTLTRLTLADVKLSSETVVAFAKMLTANSTLEVVDFFDSCLMEAEKVSALLEQDLYKDVFKRLRILWTEELLPVLTGLIRRKACWHELSVRVSASVDRDILREFFDAVAEDTTATLLHFYPNEDTTFDELADGIASVAKSTKTLKRIQNLMHVTRGNEQQLINVMEALKENRSVTSFNMHADELTPELATSLSELLAANDTLNEVLVCEYFGITEDILATILEGLRQNYTVTLLMVSWDPDDGIEGVPEMRELLKRNARLHEKAADYVCAGGDPKKDAEGADALKKVRKSAKLIERVQGLTGKTSEAASEMVQAALKTVL